MAVELASLAIQMLNICSITTLSMSSDFFKSVYYTKKGSTLVYIKHKGQ